MKAKKMDTRTSNIIIISFLTILILLSSHMTSLITAHFTNIVHMEVLLS